MYRSSHKKQMTEVKRKKGEVNENTNRCEPFQPFKPQKNEAFKNKL